VRKFGFLIRNDKVDSNFGISKLFYTFFLNSCSMMKKMLYKEFKQGQLCRFQLNMITALILFVAGVQILKNKFLISGIINKKQQWPC
jgi:hypothetical protein